MMPSAIADSIEQLVQLNAVLVAQCSRDPADLDRALTSPQPSEWMTKRRPLLQAGDGCYG